MKQVSVFISILFFTFLSFANSKPVHQRSLEELSQLKFLSYNVENLFYSEINRDSDNSHHEGAAPTYKTEEEIIGVANTIKDVNPDIVVAVEVENLQALEKFNELYLNNKYNSFLIEGNDQRGIDIGFVVKKDLPFDFKIESHKDTMWVDPKTKKKEKLFSRDVPALLISLKGEAKPFLIVLGNHAKSKRDRNGDPESNIVRTAQFEGAANIIKDYQKQYGEDVNIIFAGDFNTDVMEGKEVEPVRSLLIDSFEVAQKSLPKSERITHSFHPNGGEAHYSQMDALMVSYNMKSLVEEAGIYRYKNKDGSVKPLPKSFEERDQNPSDHMPPWMILNTLTMF